MDSEEINVVLATDIGYARQTCVTIASVIAHAQKQTNYHFWIMTDDICGVDRYVKCIPAANIHHIDYIEMREYFSHTNISLPHLTKATYYRLMLPELLYADKCIYLDSDIIVCDDLAEICYQDLDGYDFAGVKGVGIVIGESGSDYAKKIGIPSMDNYINAGVLIMNLALLRKKHYSEKAFTLSANRYPANDQDIINILSYGNIKQLPLKYNFQAGYLDVVGNKLDTVFSEDEIKEAKRHPVMIHYLTPWKPWEMGGTPYAKLWWKECVKLPFYTEFLLQYSKQMVYFATAVYEELLKKTPFTAEWYSEVAKKKSLYIYGAGKYGNVLVRDLKENGIDIEAVFVSQKEGNPEKIEGIPVTEFTGELGGDPLILIAVSKDKAVSIIRKLLDEDCYDFVWTDCNRLIEMKEFS
ncbi:MAG: glycosyltransferase family 8 protein [Lachnospiraceae bacterium]|nr:glycosyltransferase family 8 protein [Lachnospiraceae bacterium]